MWCGVKSWSPPESQFWPGLGVGVSCFEEDSDSRHVFLLDCTLSLVLYSYSQCTVLASRAASSVHLSLEKFRISFK